MSDANIKLKEAHFFIELLEALEKRGDSLTNIAPPIRGGFFLLSAILNSFYSVTEHVNQYIKVLTGKENDYKLKAQQVSDFRNKFKFFYEFCKGIRNTTVHIKHKEIDDQGYKPPVGVVNLCLRRDILN